MSRYSNRSRPISYFAEFFIISAGIMVSFLLNEWRQDSAVQDKKHSLLIEINNDLFKDSLMLESSMNMYKTMFRSHDSLLAHVNDKVEEDSLHGYIDHIISYVPFKETRISYQKILNDPELVIEEGDTLIEGFMVLHNLVYPGVHEWLDVEKSFVLNQLLPYMDEKAPFIYPTPIGRSFDGKVFYELRKESHFLNMLKSGRLYKQYLVQVCSQNLFIVSRLKKRISTYLEQQKESD